MDVLAVLSSNTLDAVALLPGRLWAQEPILPDVWNQLACHMDAPHTVFNVDTQTNWSVPHCALDYNPRLQV